MGRLAASRLVPCFILLVEELMLSHGAFVVLDHVMYTTYDLISIVVVVTDLLLLAFIFSLFIL